LLEERKTRQKWGWVCECTLWQWRWSFHKKKYYLHKTTADKLIRVVNKKVIKIRKSDSEETVRKKSTKGFSSLIKFLLKRHNRKIPIIKNYESRKKHVNKYV
jgi:hypothetical protein